MKSEFLRFFYFFPKTAYFDRKHVGKTPEKQEKNVLFYPDFVRIHVETPPKLAENIRYLLPLQQN